MEDGEKFDGDYKDGLRHGYGKSTFETGGWAGYHGDWRFGRRHGQGIEFYREGNTEFRVFFNSIYQNDGLHSKFMEGNEYLYCSKLEQSII